MIYGVGLVKTAVRFKSDYAVLQSGSTHYFVMSLFRLFGIRVIPIMHNTLWPAGFPPKSVVSRAILFLDSLFFRCAASAVLCVSPECVRQVHQLTREKHGELVRFNPQYVASHFLPQTPPPPLKPFRLLFAGRMVRDKGIFDLLQMMKELQSRLPGLATLTMCGAGPDLDRLKIESKMMGVEDVVAIRGWTAPNELRRLLADSHISIVPTRSEFSEGMAMTAIEAILSGRPVITSPVVPAIEVLRPACVAVRTNDSTSYANAVVQLIENPDLYRKLVNASSALQGMFYDRSKSSEAALKHVIQQQHYKTRKLGFRQADNGGHS